MAETELRSIEAAKKFDKAWIAAIEKLLGSKIPKLDGSPEPERKPEAEKSQPKRREEPKPKAERSEKPERKEKVDADADWNGPLPSFLNVSAS